MRLVRWCGADDDGHDPHIWSDPVIADCDLQCPGRYSYSYIAGHRIG